MKKQDRGYVAINIGANAEAIKETRVAINDILKSNAEQSTLRAALKALTKLCAINNTSIQNCTFSQSPSDK